jgi:hypothetical protein
MNTSETVRANLSDEAADEILRNTEWTKWADARDMIQAVYAKGRRAGAAAVPQVQGLTEDEVLQAFGDTVIHDELPAHKAKIAYMAAVGNAIQRAFAAKNGLTINGGSDAP